MTKAGQTGGQGTPEGYSGASQEKWDKYYEYISSVEDGTGRRREAELANKPIIERVGTFAESFSAHGFGRIYGSNRILRKSLWFLVCAVLLAVGAIQCYRVLAEYLTYPKKVEISMEEAPSMEFPAVTVCNLNPLPSKEKLKDHPLWGTFIQIEEKFSKLYCDVEFEPFDSTYEYSYDYAYNYEESEDSNEEFWDPSEEWSPFFSNDGYSDEGSQSTTEVGTSSTTTGSPSTTDTSTTQITTDSISQATTGTSDNPSQATTESFGSQATNGYDTSQMTTEGPGSEATTGATATTGTLGNEASTGDYDSQATTGIPDSQLSFSGSADQASTGSSASQAPSGDTFTEATPTGISGEASSGVESTTAAFEDLRRRRRDADAHPGPRGAHGNAAHAKLMERERVKDRRQQRPKRTAHKIRKRERAWKEPIPPARSALPKPDPKRQIFLDFDTFSQRNMHLFLDDPHRPPQHRVKREDASTAKKVTVEEVEDTRLKCSKYYKYLQSMKSEEVSEKETTVDFKNTGKCLETDYKEDVSYNPLCQIEVFCDKFGCYDFYLNKYKERSYKDKQTGEIMRCPSCSEPNCWSSNFFTSWQNGTMDYDLVVSIFNSSHTPDFSDVLGLYKPSKDDLQSYSVPPKEFLRTCSYDRRPCSYKLFYSWNSDQYGKCHTFNSAFRRIELKNGKVFNAIPWKTSSVGPRNGMRLTLSIMARNYLTLLSPELGAKIIVHSPRHIPFPEDEGFNISPGISVSVAVKTKRIERVGQPWGTCESSKDTQKEYSSLQCKKLCQEKEFWKVCGCYVGESPAYGDVSKLRPANQCSPFNVTQKLCMATVLFSYQQGLLNCKCPPPCNETVYSTQVTSSEENKGFYTIVQNIKRADMGDDLCSGSENETVRVHLYLESLNYEVIRESPAYTWDTLVCNMGGNLGLFIGMSLVTLVELLEFLIDIGILCFSGRKKTRPEAKRVEVKPASTRPPPPTQAPGLPPVSPPPEFTECSTQTHVSLQPFSKDKTWKRRALGGNDGAGKAFNRIFMSQ